MPNLPAMQSRPLRIRRIVVALMAIAATLLPVLGAPGWSSPAAAQGTCGNTDATPRLTVAPTALPAAATSTITVTGSDFLVPPHPCGATVFGGLYLFFGWVAPGGQWGPSWRNSTDSAGQFGVTFSYPGEGGGGDTRDDGTGLVRLISFTPGGTSGSETPFHLDGGGGFSTTLTVRGALYSWTDISTGRTNTVDCRTVQCGVFTIGAHGKSSRTNEQFVPVTFRTDGPAPTVAPGGVSAAPLPGSSGTRPAPGATSRPAGAGAAAGATGLDDRSAGPTPPAGGSTDAGPATTAPGAPAVEGPGGDASVDTDDSPADGRSGRRIVAGEVIAVQRFDGRRSPDPVLAAALVLGIGAAAVGWRWHRRRTQVQGPTP